MSLATHAERSSTASSDRRTTCWRSVFLCSLWTTGVTVALVIDALVRRQAGWGALTMTLAAIGTLAAIATLWFGRLPPSVPARKLVILGPYRVVRNPMAVANYFIRPDEEADLLARFGHEYASSASEVRCWIPRLRAIPTSDSTSS